MAETLQIPFCRYDFVKAQHVASVTKQLREEKSASWPEDDGATFDAFARKVDPTGAEKDKPWRYLDWACRKYLSRIHEIDEDGKPLPPILAEDMYKIGEDLALFEDKKKRKKISGADADINRYTIKTLANKAQELRGVAFDSFENLWRQAPEHIRKNTTILKRDHTGVALIPHSVAAAQHWGSGTRWCTAAEKYNKFDYYNARGPLVILNPTGTKDWYQGNRESSLMNAQDEKATMTPALAALIAGAPARFLKKEEKIAERSFLKKEESCATDPRERVLQCIEQYGGKVLENHPRLKYDRQFVLNAIRKNPETLQYAPTAFQKNRGFILEAIRKNSWALAFTIPVFQADREIVLEAVKENSGALEYASPILKADREIAFTAIRKDAMAMKHVSPELKDDRELVLEAVQQYGMMLGYASRRLRKDRDLVLEAVKRNAPAFVYADPALRWSDREIIMEAAKKSPQILKDVDPVLLEDEDFSLQLVKNNAGAFKYIHPRLKEKRHFVLEAVRGDGYFFKDVKEEFRADKEIATTAIKNCQHNLCYYLAKSLLGDQDFIRELVQKDGLYLQYADPALKANKQIVLEAVRNNGSAFAYASEDFRSDREIMLLAAQICDQALDESAPALQNDPVFRRECALINAEIMLSLPEAERASFSLEERNSAFDQKIVADWQNIRYADDLNIELTAQRQKSIFTCARAKDHYKLADTLHLFPALRPAWKDRDLNLDEAAAILDRACAREKKPLLSPVPG